ncbi:MAG: hypothetical protein A3G34_11795 [Candidatus Lindowbacteria bacterium RIFCSPLOWO2_12_FULL_62_27]|nr:MAG: hypothetical protein A3G34_11795 [Candidatus Lindowbacteria bacterium RIFCSPLOWO2_12_FULL_62_27]
MSSILSVAIAWGFVLGAVAGAERLDVSDPAKWNSGQADGASIGVKTVETPGGKGIVVSVDLSRGDWAQVWQDADLNLEGITAVRINLRCAGSKNRLEVKLVDADGTNFGTRLDDLAFDGAWREVAIPYSRFEYFWGGTDTSLDLAKVTSVWMAVSKIEGGASDISFDRIDLDLGASAPRAAPPTGAESEMTFRIESADWDRIRATLDPDRAGGRPARVRMRQKDDHHNMEVRLLGIDGSDLGGIRLANDGSVQHFPMDRPDEWKSEHADGASIRTAAVPGADGRALEITYDLSAGDWVQISQEKKMDLSAARTVHLKLRMTGARNAVEIKLVDADGTNFGVKLEDVPLASDGAGAEWTDLPLPVSRFAYFWGGDDRMDWANTASIWIAISKMEGGAGVLVIDDVRLDR